MYHHFGLQETHPTNGPVFQLPGALIRPIRAIPGKGNERDVWYLLYALLPDGL